MGGGDKIFSLLLCHIYQITIHKFSLTKFGEVQQQSSDASSSGPELPLLLGDVSDFADDVYGYIGKVTVLVRLLIHRQEERRDGLAHEGHGQYLLVQALAHLLGLGNLLGAKVPEKGVPRDRAAKAEEAGGWERQSRARTEEEEDDEDDEDEGRDNNPGVTYLRSFKSAAKLS